MILSDKDYTLTFHFTFYEVYRVRQVISHILQPYCFKWVYVIVPIIRKSETYDDTSVSLPGAPSIWVISLIWLYPYIFLFVSRTKFLATTSDCHSCCYRFSQSRRFCSDNTSFSLVTSQVRHQWLVCQIQGSSTTAFISYEFSAYLTCQRKQLLPSPQLLWSCSLYFA